MWKCCMLHGRAIHSAMNTMKRWLLPCSGRLSRTRWLYPQWTCGNQSSHPARLSTDDSGCCNCGDGQKHRGDQKDGVQGNDWRLYADITRDGESDWGFCWWIMDHFHFNDIYALLLIRCCDTLKRSWIYFRNCNKRAFESGLLDFIPWKIICQGLENDESYGRSATADFRIIESNNDDFW